MRMTLADQCPSEAFSRVVRDGRNGHSARRWPLPCDHADIVNARRGVPIAIFVLGAALAPSMSGVRSMGDRMTSGANQT